MKKTVMKLLVLGLVISCFMASLVPARADEWIDIEEYSTLEEQTIDCRWENAYGCYCFPVQYYGQYVCLGNYDLSKFNGMTIVVGMDLAAVLVSSSGRPYTIALTKNGPVQDSAGAWIDTAEVIGTVEIAEPPGASNWGRDEIYIEFDTDYSGEVWLAVFCAAVGHTVLMSDMWFNSIPEPATPSPEPTEVPEATATPEATKAPEADPTDAPATKAPAKADDEGSGLSSGETIAIVAMIATVVVVGGLIVILLIVKKKGVK